MTVDPLSTYREASRLRAEGDLSRAARLFDLAHEQFKAQGNPKAEFVSRFDAARCYVELHKPRAAIDRYKDAIVIVRASPDGVGPAARSDMATALTNLGQLQHDVQDYDDALVSFAESLRVYQDLGREEREAWTMNSIGRLYLEQGSPSEARPYLEDAIEILERHRELRDAALARVNLGAVLHDLHESDLALGEYRKARAFFLDAKDEERVAECDANIAVELAGLGELGEASELIERALEVFEGLGLDTTRALGMITLADILWDQGLGDEAIRTLLAAAKLFAAANNPLKEANTIARAGGLMLADWRYDEAVEALENGLRQLESVRRGIRGTEPKIWMQEASTEIYDLLVSAYVAGGRPVEALLAAERAKTPGLAMTVLASRSERDQVVLDQALDVQKELVATRAAIADIGPPSGEQSDALQRLQRRERELRLSVRSLEAEAADRALELDLDALDLPRLRAALGPNKALLEYVTGERSSSVIAVTNDRVEAHRVAGANHLRAKVEGLRWTIQAQLRVAHQVTLYEELVGPVADMISNRELLIVPDGPLHQLPFAVLRPPASAPTAVLATSQPTRYAPSFRVALALRDRLEERFLGNSARSRIAAFAVTGESVPGGRPASLPSDVRSMVSGYEAMLEPLPNTFEEVRRVVAAAAGLELRGPRPLRMRTRSATIATDGAATKRAVKEAIARGPHRYWHLACHCVADDEAPEHSGLLLSSDSEMDGDSFWRTYEVASSEMICELATLSACSTGLGKTLRSEGVLGLARAFIQAGASSVCASLWPVADRETSHLMGDFYDHLAAGETESAALALAQRSLIESGAHPYHWGSFVLIGRL